MAHLTWNSLQSGRHGNLCVGVFYRPPSSSCSIFDTLLDSSFSINHSYFSTFVLLGDFNANLANPDDFLTEDTNGQVCVFQVVFV